MTHFCHNCNRETAWAPGPRYERCTQCRTSFPCRHKCDHLDCAVARLPQDPRSSDVTNLCTEEK